MKKKWPVIVITTFLIIIASGAVLFIFRGAILNKFAASAIFISGKPLKFGDYTISVEKVEGNKLYGIEVSDNEKKFTAKSGTYEYLPQDNLIKLSLSDGVSEFTDPKHPDNAYKLTFNQYNLKIKLSGVLPKFSVNK